VKEILGTKLGMTQIFEEDGRAVPVTVIEAGPCTVVQKKTAATDQYEGLQVAYGRIADKHVNRPLRGHYERAGVEPHRHLREIRTENFGDLNVGDRITVGIFSAGELVDVTGTSRGKGYAGGIRRWGFHRGPMSHGSKYHRGPGSLQSRDASRVFKGRRLPGRLGGERVTVRGLRIVRVDADRNLLLVAGAVPGPRRGLVQVRSSSVGAGRKAKAAAR